MILRRSSSAAVYSRDEGYIIAHHRGARPRATRARGRRVLAPSLGGLGGRHRDGSHRVSPSVGTDTERAARPPLRPAAPLGHLSPVPAPLLVDLEIHARNGSRSPCRIRRG